MLAEMWSDLKYRARALFRGSELDAELNDELRAHLERKASLYEQQGRSRADAMRQARLDLGGVERIREESRDGRGIGFLETTWMDVRYGTRTLLKSPVFLISTVLTLALGIGANLAIFTLVNAVLLRPLPFPQPDRLVRVFDDLPGAGVHDVGMSIPELRDLQERSGVFESITGLVSASTALSGGDRVERIELLGTTPNYFEVLGAKAALGRTYGQAEWSPKFLDGVVISDGLWRRQFGADPHILGRKIRVDEDPYTIIGVMAPDFRHPGNTLGGDVDIWAASGMEADPFPNPPIRAARFIGSSIGRLKPGITLEQAQRRLAQTAAQLQEAYPADYPARFKWSLRVEPAQASLTGGVRSTLVILLAAVGVVLLIVCVNVASLLIARASTRTREFAVRQAMGASQRRLVRQVLTESVLIALAGGAAAVVVLRLTGASLLALMPADVPRLAEVHVDWRMIVAAFGLSALTGIIFGLTPALHATAVNPNQDLKEGGRAGSGQTVHQGRARAVLVVMEVALSVVLLVSAGLLVRSFAATLRQNPGFDAGQLTAGQIWIPVPNNPKANKYLTPPPIADFARELLRQLGAVPGVDQVALGSSNDVPLLNAVGNPRPFSMPDEAVTQESDHSAEFGAVSAGYFAALKTPVRSGRVFTDHDDGTSPRVVVVNEAFVRAFSPDRNPVGRRVHVGRTPGQDLEIIGVVGDVRYHGLDQAPPPKVYGSFLQNPNIQIAVFVRTRSSVALVRDALTQTVHSIDAELPVFGVRTTADLLATSMARRRFSLTLMAGFAVLALILAAVGIYGVMAFVVGQRTQEFGIRLALGAQPKDILGLAFRPGIVLTATGMIIGLAVSVLVTRLIS
ncbi:MAG TPA: ABC transporter permease, partial [Gemmatimonadales bacterium]